jgi:hypothetical protein
MNFVGALRRHLSPSPQQIPPLPDAIRREVARICEMQRLIFRRAAIGSVVVGHGVRLLFRAIWSESSPPIVLKEPYTWVGPFFPNSMAIIAGAFVGTRVARPADIYEISASSLMSDIVKGALAGAAASVVSLHTALGGNWNEQLDAPTLAFDLTYAPILGGLSAALARWILVDSRPR